MLNIQPPMATPQAQKAFIRKAEETFTVQIAQIAEQLSSHSDLKVILLAGPTCSGKTTTASILCRHLGELGHPIHQVSIDDFYRERTDTSISTDYESLSAIDFPYLKQCVTDILANRAVALPKFDFVTGQRVDLDTVRPEKGKIFLFEGIQAIYPEVSNLMPKESRATIFISPVESVNVSGEVFLDSDIRLARRIVRDMLFRGFLAEHTLLVWDHVRENEKKNIYPYRNEIDIHINSFLAYELFVIKPYITKFLGDIPDNSPAVLQRDWLLAKFEKLPKMDRSFVPEDSVFCEFIGK